MVDDTGALKEAYYGSGSTTPSSGSSGSSDVLSGISSALSAVNPALGFASNLIGGLLGFGSQKSANEANIQMQRETNRLQYQMFREANAFSERMWNMQNEYNSPEKQAERLKAAGINPAFVFGNGSISEAGGITSSSSPSLTAPHMDPYNPLPAVNTAVDAFLQSQYNNAQIKQMRENERHLAIQNDLDNMTLFKKIEALDVDNRTKQYLLNWYFNTDKARQDALTKNNTVLDAQAGNILANTMAVTIHANMEQKLGESQLRLNQQQLWSVAQYVAQNWQQLANDAARIQNEKQQTKYYGESVQGQNSYLGNAAIHMMHQDAGYFEQIGISREMMDSEKFKNYVGTVLGGLGSFVGAAGGAFFGGKGVFSSAPAAVRGFR